MNWSKEIKGRLKRWIPLVVALAGYAGIVALVAIILEDASKPWKVILILLVGIAFAIGNELGRRLKAPKGKYEWQWAGENWLGKVTLEKKGRLRTATVLVRRYFKRWSGEKPQLTPGQLTITLERGPVVLRSTKDGTVEVTPDGISLSLPVEQSIFKHDDPTQVIKCIALQLKGDLKRVGAFAGKVQYEQSPQHYAVGDMILVNYDSTVGFDF